MLLEILTNTYDVILEAAPYIFFGLIAAGLLEALPRPDLLGKWLAPRTFGSVAKATLVGAPLPLCSCSVLPVAMQLRRNGANRGATSAFLISTPQSSADSVLLSIGMLHPVFAVARIVGAIVTGFAAGIVQNLFGGKDEAYTGPGEVVSGCCAEGDCGTAPASEPRGWVHRLYAGQRQAFRSILPSLSHYYLIGFIATGVLLTFLPDGLLEDYLGGGVAGMAVAGFAGVAMYLCASAATPLAAVLIAKGMSPGTALVLLLAGPATSLASMVAVKALLGMRGLTLYLVTIIVCAILLGLAFDGFSTLAGWRMSVPPLGEVHEHASVISHMLAGLLSALMLYWTARRYFRRFSPPKTG